MNNKFFCTIFVIVILASCSTKKTIAEKNVPTVNNQIVGVDVAHADGQKLYEANCAKCHKLFDPSEFSAEEWKPIMVRMQVKAKISDAETAKIYAYLTALK